MNRKVHVLLGVLLAGLFLCPAGAFAQKGVSQRENQALKAAEQFLAFVDAGQYQNSYAATSTLFRSQVSQKEWVAKVAGTRPNFGAVISRQLQKAKYLTSVPGAPDGQYFVFVFRTSFKHKKRARELVTTNKDKDGRWRVSGYFIR